MPPSPGHQRQDRQERNLHFVAGGGRQSHRSRPGQARPAEHVYTLKCLDLCGKLGIPNIGGQSGTMPGMPLAEAGGRDRQGLQREIFSLRARRTRCASCGSPTPAVPTSPPVRWAGKRLFKAFNDSPHVGLQFDPSHLVWQFMDPVAAAREFADKIYDVHLKDTEILWHLVKRGGIQPVNGRAGGVSGCREAGRWIGRASSACSRKWVYGRDEYRGRGPVLLPGVQRARTSRSSTSAASGWRTSF
jgi:sugar phosphate isomerase/epimerase